MLTVPPDEIALEALIGQIIPSDVFPGVGYRIVWRLGEGAMSVVFYALRVTNVAGVAVNGRVGAPAVSGRLIASPVLCSAPLAVCFHAHAPPHHRRSRPGPRCAAGALAQS